MSLLEFSIFFDKENINLLIYFIYIAGKRDNWSCKINIQTRININIKSKYIYIFFFGSKVEQFMPMSLTNRNTQIKLAFSCLYL